MPAPQQMTSTMLRTQTSEGHTIRLLHTKRLRKARAHGGRPGRRTSRTIACWRVAVARRSAHVLRTQPSSCRRHTGGGVDSRLLCRAAHAAEAGVPHPVPRSRRASRRRTAAHRCATCVWLCHAPVSCARHLIDIVAVQYVGAPRPVRRATSPARPRGPARPAARAASPRRGIESARSFRRSVPRKNAVRREIA